MGEIMRAGEKNSQIALVLDPEFGDELNLLQALMPVWIIDSPQNQSVVEKNRNPQSSGEGNLITTFQAREGESLAMVCERIVQSLDDHHNEHSQTPGYRELRVIGVSLGDVSLQPFLELHFDQFVRTATGFIARKSEGAL
jgi:hypothetical protein